MKNIRLRIGTFVVLLFAGLSLFAQQMKVKGTVVDKATGETIIGASVVEEGTQNGVITDIDGNFVISVSQNATISISYVGFKTVKVQAAPALRIEMDEDNAMLDEVVVTGYTTQRKADLTGSVSVVSVDELKTISDPDPMRALQGKVPGMTITANGSPSGVGTVRTGSPRWRQSPWAAAVWAHTPF